jgi:hypothetical protein
VNNHLSATQISRLIAGQQEPEEEFHLRHCPTCSAELARVQSGFAAFGRSVREWARQSDMSMDAAPWTPPVSTVRPRPRLLGFAAAAIALAVGLPVYQEYRATRNEARWQRDAELLEQVHAQLSRAVPASMQPLMELMYEERQEPQ